ncbi:RICIN domain-containing protein, partial [Streptomyces sp. NPDC058272]|uniref:RICIN domain-containing protein n=1 Tax=Streptomyces sp. NPDC058272 TaxID=3346415 RepID=UPI0036EF8EFD
GAHSDGQVTLISFNSNSVANISTISTESRYLDVPNASTDPNKRLQLNSSTGAGSQQWLWVPSTSNVGYGQLVNLNSGLCMDIDGAQGSNIIQYPCKVQDDSTLANQLWKQQSGSDGMQLKSATGQYLHTADGTDVEAAGEPSNWTIANNQVD